MADSPKISIITTDETDDSGSNRDIEVGSSRPQAPSEATKRHPRELLWCIYAIFVLVLSSFDNQAGGVVLSIPQFRKDFGSPYDGNYVLSAEWQSAYSGAPVLSSIVGLLVSGWLADKIGRKWMFAIGYLIVFVSITIETLSTSNLVFFIGKFVAGFAIGAFTTTALTYLGEVAPRPARGILTAAAGMALTVGPFIVSIVVRATGDEPNRWAYRSVFLAQYGFSATGAFLLPCMPESPWWLLSKGRKHEASVALSHFGYTVDQAQDYMTAAITALDHAREETKGATYLECFQKTNLRRTIIAAAPLSIQALSGLFFVSSYSTYYQQLAGYNTSTTFSLNIVQNILAMTGNACSWFLIDRVGRRPLSCYGMLLLTVLLLLTGGLACIGTKSATKGTVGLLLLYNWLYSITIGATAYPILIETPTSRLRTKTAAIGLTLQNGLFAMWAFVIPYLFNPDQANLGARVAFIFGAFAVVSTIYLWSCFDGILALAPAVNWGHFFPVMAWPHQRMYEEKAFPRACEFAALRDAAIEACDMLDGVQDGVISAPELCNFDPIGKINQPFFCKDTNSTLHFTTAATRIAQAAWTGPRGSDGKFLWYGYAMDADLSMITATTCKDAKSSNPANCTANPFSNAASCDDESVDCTAVPFPLSDSWFRHWVTADPELDTTSLSRDDFTSLIHQGIQHYDSIIGTRDPDLSAFQKHGGKLLTWHGITDQIIPFGGSTSYHDRVASLDPRVNDYFRLFLAPGTAHCLPGNGPFPYRALEDLIEWVERGVAPERLVAQRIEDLDAETGLLRHDVERAGDRGRPLCLYPKRQEYIGGDVGVMGSYRCVSP